MGGNCLSEYKICDLNKVVWFQEGPGVRKNQFRTSGVKLLNVGNICDRELILDKTSIYISEEEAYGKYKHFLVDEGDLLIASSGIKVEYFDKKITFAKKEHLPLCMNTSTIRFKVLDKDVLDINYFRHFLASRYFTKQVQFYITGSAQLNFGPSHLNKMKIIVPPIEEQRKIAQILDKADEIRQKKKLANDKLDEFLKSTFITMFGDPVRNEQKHPKQALCSLCNKITDGTHDTPPRYDSGVMIITGKNIRPFKIDYSQLDYVTEADHKIIYERCNPEYGDVLYTNIGVNLGTAVMNNIHEEFSMKNVALLKNKREVLNSRFLEHILNFNTTKSEIIRISSLGGAQKFLSLQQIRNFEIIVPPIEDQNKFAQIVEKVEAQKQKNELVIEQMNNLFNSLSQRAFKGGL